MSQKKAERLLNLHIMLLGARRFVPKERIREALYGDYPATEAGDDAFERSFERDKEDLRAIGALIEVGSNDAYFDDEVGYRIPTDQTSLPELRFAPDEAAVVGLAARIWRESTLASAAGSAHAKLLSMGVDLDSARLDVVTPSIDTSEPSFEQFWEATQQRRVTTFNYRATGRPETQRRLQPWGVVRSSGRWYVVGFDLDREAQRVFRLSRVVGAVKLGRKPEAYVIPEDADIRAVARDLAPQLPRREISYLARRGTAQGLRRRALQVTTAVPGPDGTTSWDRLIVELTAPDAVWEALSHAPDAVVESPDEVRAEVLKRLHASVGGQ